MSSTLNLGFIGGALNSAVGYTHFAASRMDNRFRLVAGCFSRDADINARSAIRYGVDSSHVHADWRGLLASENRHIDAVVILTPTPTHRLILGEAIASGIPVICEKALASTCEDAEEIAHATAAHNGHVAVTYNYTGYPMVRELRQMIRDGRLGRIRHVQVEMPQEGFARTVGDGSVIPAPQAWRLIDGAIPTVSLDLGVHVHHLVEFLTGEVALEVACDQRSCGHFPSVIDDVSSIALYTGDLRVNYWYGKTALGHRNGLSIRIFGSEASASWLQMTPEILQFHRVNGEMHVIDRASPGVRVANQERYTRFKAGHPAGFLEAFANHYADIADGLELRRNGSPQPFGDFVFDPQCAVRGLSFLDASARAARARTWQKVRNALPPMQPGPAERAEVRQ